MLPYLIRTFRGGISDETDKGIEGSYKHGYGLDIHGRDDVLTGKQAMATVFDVSTGVLSGSHTGTTQAGIIQFFVPATDGSLYCFGSTGSIFTRSGDGQWTFSYNDENGAIKGAAEWKLSDGTNWLYWATATSLARKQLQGADITPDSGTGRWTDATQDYKTTLNAADWHTMKNASGELIIANAESASTVDFAGNFVANDLNIRPGNLIKCLEERDDYAILGSGRLDNSEEGHLWSWITTVQTWIQKKRIPVKGINSMISTELLLLQGGDNGEIFFSDFVNSVPLHAIPGGGQSMPDGVSIEDDLAIWGIYGGTYPGLWSYGRRRKNRPHALNYDYRLARTVAGSSISTIAAVAMVNGELLASWGTTDGSISEYGVDAVSSTTKAVGIYEGLEFSGGAPHLKKEFETVKLTLSPLVSGTSVSVKYRKDNATTGGDSSANEGFRYAVTGNGATSFSEASAVEAIFSIGDAANVYEVGVELNPTSNLSPEIHSVVTYIGDGTQDYA